MCNSIKTNIILRGKFCQVSARFTLKSTKLLKEIEEDLNKYKDMLDSWTGR